MRNLLFASLLFLSTMPVDSFADRDRDRDRNVRKSQAAREASTQQLQDGSGVRISNQRAASLVRERYAGSRILGVMSMAGEGATVYRVRTLTSDGVVKSVFVDGRSGQVFE